MPPLDDNIEEMNTSDISETLDVAEGAPEPAQPEAAATSSDATGATDDSTLSIVRDVVNAGKDAPASAASPAEGQEDGQSTGEATTKEQDDENYSDVPFHKHPRFQQLLRKAKTFENDATQYQNVQKFMDQNGLDAEEAAEGFVIMALMKTDPAAAWEKLKPHVQGLLQAAGEVLPPDLAQMVQQGQMTSEAAFEVSRARAQVQSVRTNQSFKEQQAQRQQHMSLSQSLYDTAASWEADRREKDPNFEAKLIPLQKELAFLQMREGKPTSPEGVRDQLQRAYKAVTPPPAPAPAARPVPPRAPQTGRFVPSGQAQNAQPKPQTTLDIIRANRRSSA